MNVAALPENEPSFLTVLLRRWLPTRYSTQTLFWASFPTFLFLFNVGVSWLKPSPFALYLPFVALTTFPLVLRYRVLGVSISYLALGLMLLWLIPSIEPSERLWQMGVFFNLALTLYITLLTFEEIECCFVEVQESLDTHHASANEIASELQAFKSQAEEKRQELEVEIQKLKSEAELRRIEKNQQHRHFELIQSEIELLNSQKESFIQDAREARSAAAKAEQQLFQERSLIEQERSKFENERSLIDQERLRCRHDRSQYEQTQAALAAHQELVQTWRNQASQAEEALQQSNSQLAAWEERATDWQTQKAQLEETNCKLYHQLHEEIISAQETILLLQQKPPVILEIEKYVEKPIVSLDISSEKVEQLQKALNKAQGLHAQLQSQFQDKADVLSQTRRELFATQGRLEVLEKEALSAGLIPDREEAHVLEQAVTVLSDEITLLEEEIVRLETLITTLISFE